MPDECISTKLRVAENSLFLGSLCFVVSALHLYALSTILTITEAVIQISIYKHTYIYIAIFLLLHLSFNMVHSISVNVCFMQLVSSADALSLE